MARHPLSTLFARLRPPPGSTADTAPDADLLQRWAVLRDPAAFELLVWRHGALVLGTCRRVARDDGDAEDAFQATFLVLSRKASSVTASLPGWLHRTARRAALRAAGRRETVSLPADLPAASVEPRDGEALTHLDDAVNALGERHRRVVVLCYLQGHTADAAAKLLGVPRGTVLSRLATARQRLAATLTRRGVTLPALLTTTTLSYDRVEACVSVALDPRAAAPAAAIAQGVLLMMLRTKITVAIAVLAAVTVGVAGTGTALMPQAGGPTPAAASPPKPPADTPASAMRALTAEVAAAEKTLADRVSEWKQRQSKVPPADLRAKTELLGSIDLLIFKSEVEIRKTELQLDPMQQKLEKINAIFLTEEQLLNYAGQRPLVSGSNELNSLGDNLRQTRQLLTPRTGRGEVAI